MIIFLVVLSILIIVHEFGHLMAAKKLGVKVDKFSLGFGPRLIGKKIGGTDYSVSMIPLGGYVKLAGDTPEERKGDPDEYLSKGPGKRAWIVVCGPLLNVVLGFLCFWIIFYAGFPTYSSKIGSVLDGFGAKSAGLIENDKIVSVNAKAVSTWEDLQQAVQKASQEKKNFVRLQVVRNGSSFAVDVELKQKSMETLLGDKRSMALLGISPSSEIITVRYGFFKSFILSFQKTWQLTDLTYRAIARMITGRLSFRKSLSGPLGIYMITKEAANLGLTAVLNLIGLLSVSLAIFNLLPLPALDGGHLFFLMVEKIRGRQLSVKAEQIITQIGFGLIILLALFVTYNDIARIFGDKISVFFNKQP
jgi:regulator of sigma E protease